MKIDITNQDKKQWTMIIKFSLLAIVGLFFLIPLNMIESTIIERQKNGEKVKQEISKQWATRQTFSGPVLNIPVKAIAIKKEDKPETSVWHIMPETLLVSGTIDPEIRSRGIYQSVVYSSDMQISGELVLAGISLLKDYEVSWDEAYLSVGISDNRGLKGEIILVTDAGNLKAEPGIADHNIFESGISFKCPVTDTSKKISFKMAFILSGSDGLFISPLGKTTKAHLESAWKSPGFSGSFLPVKRTVNNNGFSADWEVTHLNRNFPQNWIGSSFHPEESSFGCELLIPVDHYQKSWRSVRYGILFIALTFLVLIFLEISKKETINVFNYVLVSSGLVLFFSLLTSLSEHIGFNLSYLISSIATIGLISVFTRSILKNKKAVLIIAGMLAVLYSFIFVLLSMNDYAFLAGNIGLFILLAVIMWQAGKLDLLKKETANEIAGYEKPE